MWSRHSWIAQDSNITNSYNTLFLHISASTLKCAHLHVISTPEVVAHFPVMLNTPLHKQCLPTWGLDMICFPKDTWQNLPIHKKYKLLSLNQTIPFHSIKKRDFCFSQKRILFPCSLPNINKCLQSDFAWPFESLKNNYVVWLLPREKNFFGQ